MLITPKKSFRPTINQSSTRLCVVQTDMQGIITFANPIFSATTGITPEKLVNSFLPGYFENGSRFFDELDTSLLADNGIPMEADLTIKSTGRSIAIKWIISSFKANGQLFLQWAGIDINRQKNHSSHYDSHYLSHQLPAIDSNDDLYQALLLQLNDGAACFVLENPCSVYLPKDQVIDCLLQKSILSACNEAFAEMYGFEKTGNDLSGSFLSIITEETADLKEYLRTFIQSGFYLANAIIYKTVKEKGTRIFITNLAGVIQDDQLHRVWVTQRDVTEQRTAEERLQLQADLIDNVSDIIISTDIDFRVVIWNKVAEKTYNVPASQAVGKKVSELVEYEYINTTAETALTTLIEKGTWNGEVIFRNEAGEPIYLLCNISKLEDKKNNAIGYVAVNRDITDRKRSEQQLQGYSEHITNILSSITDGFIALDFEFNVLWWNPIAAKLTGIRDVDVLGKSLWEVMPALKSTKILAEYRRAIIHKTAVNFELYLDELKVYFDINVYPSQQGLFIYFKDITGRKKQEMLLKLEKEVLELNANPAVTLQKTVDCFLIGIEHLNPGMLCSVVLLDETGSRTQHLSAPHLSQEFKTALSKLKAGPEEGSCGTAIFLRRAVIVSDIMNDPLWKNCRDVATQFQLAACWSFPVITSGNTVLGSLAAYYREVQMPTQEQTDLLQRAATLLGIIIENKQAEQKISVSNERYLLAMKATNDAIWDYDLKNQRLYWGESFYTLFGYDPTNKIDDRQEIWESKIHPDDRERVINLYSEALQNRDKGVVNAEYRFLKANGQYAIVSDRAFVVYDSDGEPSRYIGSMQDVTERKKLEKQLLKQEIDKQKIIAQAVVDAQEKERAEIGKDLHDNVNQILSTAKLYLELAKTDTSQKEELIKRSADSIFNAINEIRSISKALVPPSVKDLGIVDSIKDLAESLQITRVLKVKFNYEGDFENAMSDKQKLMLFRIIQEQVNNVLKHAEASKLTIDLLMHDKKIDLTIEDNGKGFEMEKVRFKKGVGLSNIESRANLFNGRVIITTAPGKGCKLFIQVPIHNH